MGTTVIDSLVVTLGLDPTQFTKGQKQAATALLATRKEAESTAKEMEERGKQAAQFFTRIRNEALSFFAVLTVGSGLKNFIESTIGDAASLGRTAENLKMSTRDLAAWQLAAKRAGGTAEGITAQLQASQLELQRARIGQGGEAWKWFLINSGGMDTSKIKTGNDLLLAQSKIIHDAYVKDPGRAQLIAQQMGVTADNFNLLKQGPEAVLALVDAQRKNAVVTEANSKAAQDLQNKWYDVEDRFKAVATRIAIQLFPVFERLMDKLLELAQWVADHQDDITEWVDKAVKAIIAFAESLDKGAKSLGGWKNILIGLVAINLLPLVTSVLSLATAFLRLGGAIGTAGTEAAASALWKVIGKAGVGAALLFHTDELGAGEQEELARRRAIGDKGPVFTGTKNGDSRSQVMNQLQAYGWTREQAAGIAGNFLAENSQLDPTAVGDNGSAIGIGQWHPDRQAAFKKKFGKDLSSANLSEQVEFANYELTEGNEKAAGDRLRGATSAGDAGSIISRYYERPGKDEEARIMEAKRRARLAEAEAYRDQQETASAVASNADVAQSSAGAGRGGQGGPSSTEINIDKIEVHTQATDAAGISRDIGAAVKKNSFVTQANTGLN